MTLVSGAVTQEMWLSNVTFKNKMFEPQVLCCQLKASANEIYIGEKMLEITLGSWEGTPWEGGGGYNKVM